MIKSFTINNKEYGIKYFNGLYIVISENKEIYYGTYQQCLKYITSK